MTSPYWTTTNMLDPVKSDKNKKQSYQVLEDYSTFMYINNYDVETKELVLKMKKNFHTVCPSGTLKFEN